MLNSIARLWVDVLALLRAHDVEVDPALADAVDRFYLGTRGRLITGGTNEIQRTIIAQQMGLPRWST